VPLIGERLAEDGRRAATNHVPASRAGRRCGDDAGAPNRCRARRPRFGQLFDRFAKRRVVLLGEASHGTSEFYRAARPSRDG